RGGDGRRHVGGGEAGAGGVGEPALDADLRIEPGGVAPAQHVVGDQRREIILGGARRAGGAHQNGGLADLRHVDREGAGLGLGGGGCSGRRQGRRRLGPPAQRLLGGGKGLGGGGHAPEPEG